MERQLSYFDLMNLVIGAIIGSDIYIVPGITAGLVGPFAIAIWIVGGAMSMVLAMVFAYCSFYVPNVGGSFAFVSKAFDQFYGFVAGWSMCIAEVVALPVFAIVFTNYLQYFVPLGVWEQQSIRILFVGAITGINLVGVKAAGRVNDVLTLVKLTPLLMIIVLGVSSLLFNPRELANYAPFVPMGFGNFGTAMVLIFWAYAGFELGSLPADEVVEPKKNIPRAVISGMVIVIFFYVMTNAAVFGVVNWSDLAKSPIPLVMVSAALLGTAGATITGVGALASVTGTDDTEVLGTARLVYAMSIDGLLPRFFSRVHPRFKTPYFAILLESGIAAGLSLFTGITALISFAVFNLGVCYLLVCLALSVLKRRSAHSLHGQTVLPWLGVLISVYLLLSTPLPDIAVGGALVLLGMPVYFKFAPRTEATDLKAKFLSEEAVLARNLERQNRFLANFVRLVARRRRSKVKGRS